MGKSSGSPKKKSVTKSIWKRKRKGSIHTSVGFLYFSTTNNSNYLLGCLHPFIYLMSSHRWCLLIQLKLCTEIEMMRLSLDIEHVYSGWGILSPSHDLWDFSQGVHGNFCTRNYTLVFLDQTQESFFERKMKGIYMYIHIRKKKGLEMMMMKWVKMFGTHPCASSTNLSYLWHLQLRLRRMCKILYTKSWKT